MVVNKCDVSKKSLWQWSHLRRIKNEQATSPKMYLPFLLKQHKYLCGSRSHKNFQYRRLAKLIEQIITYIVT